MAPEQLDDFFRFVLPEQTVIDEDASELIADRLMDQKRGDGGVDAAGEPADHAALPDLLADARDFRLAELRHGPIAGATGDAVHEIGEQLGAVRRVHHFGVELHAVDLALVIGDRGERRAVRDADAAEALRQLGHAVAVAHPDLRALALAPHPVEQRRLVHDLDLGAAELAVMPAFDHAAKRGDQSLLAIADAEHRHVRIEDGLVHPRRARLMHGWRVRRRG